MKQNRNISNIIQEVRDNPIQELKPRKVMGQRSNRLIEAQESEYVVWGIPPDKTDEEPLYTKATSMEDAEKAVKILQSDHGCTALRIQTLELNDGSEVIRGFAQAVNASITRKIQEANDSDKYVVTAFVKKIDRRDRLSRPLTKAEADKFAKNHDADMKLAVPEYQWSKDTKVEKESELIESKKLQEDENSFTQLSADGDFSLWSTITSGTHAQNMSVIEIGEKAFELHSGSSDDLRLYKSSDGNQVFVVSENEGLGYKGMQLIDLQDDDLETVGSEDGDIHLAPMEMSTFIQSEEDYEQVKDMDDETFIHEYMPY